MAVRCPKCGSETVYISILCWVSAEDGEVLEAAGDFNDPDIFEPPMMAFCGNCDTYFSPDHGHKFTVIDGVPSEERLP